MKDPRVEQIEREAKPAMVAHVTSVQRVVLGIEKDLKEFREEVGQRFDEVDKRFDEVNRRFEQVDRRFEQVDRRFDEMQADVDRRFDEMKTDVGRRFDRMDGKLDVITDMLGRGLAAGGAKQSI